MVLPSRFPEFRSCLFYLGLGRPGRFQFKRNLSIGACMWPFDLPEADKVYAFRNRETNYVYKFDSARDSWRPTQTGPAIFTSIASRAAVSTWAIREKLKLFTCASWHTPPPRNVTVMVKFQFIPRYYLLINAFVACDATSSAQMFLDYATWSNFFFSFPRLD